MTEFEKAVDAMRAAQKAYFRTRDENALKNSKHWEAEVDKHLQELKGERIVFA